MTTEDITVIVVKVNKGHDTEVGNERAAYIFSREDLSTAWNSPRTRPCGGGRKCVGQGVPGALLAPPQNAMRGKTGYERDDKESNRQVLPAFVPNHAR